MAQTLPFLRIYLIGMPASGKSTLGKHLAELIGYECIDLDKLIEFQQDKSIADIFEQQGEEYFRIVEQKILHQTFSLQRKIIATGGGTPCYFDNIQQIKQHGLSVFLAVSSQELAKRIHRQTHIQRPLFQEKSIEELTEQLTTKIQSRLPYYRQADMMVSAESQNARQLAEYLKSFMENWQDTWKNKY